MRNQKRWSLVTVSLIVLSILIGLSHTLSIAQAQDAISFPSGHWLGNTYGFLTYWKENNGEKILGAPITGPFQEHGTIVQYFERGRLELHTEIEGSPILLGRVGADYASALWMSFNFHAPALYKSQSGDSVLASTEERSASLPENGERFFQETGFTLRKPFLLFWEEGGGLATFGYPISQPIWGYVDNELLLVQYFERARLERHSIGQDRYEVRISSLGRDLALLRGYDMTPPDPGTLTLVAVHTPEHPAENPTPTPEPATPTPTPTPEIVVPTPLPPVSQGGGKYIIVNLSQQWLYAYQGDALVFDAPVSTGRDGFNTPTGTFSIYAKVPVQTMSGTIGGESYYVPNVPHAMYIYGGVAMHGTYWHNQFGTGVRMSHGCINLPLDSAAWIYEWAPVGTTVYVRY
jgi:lipoprotein-anchoring transpeptidase ErfK/SrfK